MRLLLDNQKRVLPNFSPDQPKLNRTHIEVLAADSILLDRGSFKDFESKVALLPASTAREILKEKIFQGQICYVDQDLKAAALEATILPEGTFRELVDESGAWFEACTNLRRATKYGESSDEAFSRLLKDILAVSKSITVVDKYLTGSLLVRALGEESARLFWFDKLLDSGPLNIHLYFGDVTTDHLKNTRGVSSTSRVFGLTQAQRVAVLIDFLSSQLAAKEFEGTVDVWLSRKMPHDRQIRVALDGKRNGILYLGLSKGIDMFETDPIDGSYSLFTKTKLDWQELMNRNSGEWPKSSRSNPWICVTKKETSHHAVTAWLFEEN